MSGYTKFVKTLTCAAMLSALYGGAPAYAKTVISFWHPFGDVYGEGVRKVADAFNKSQNKVEVRPVTVAESSIKQEKLMSAMAAGSPPDCAMFADLLVAEYAQSKLLLNLDPYIKAARLTSKNFWRPAWGVTFYDDKQWALPFTEDDRAMFYNKTVLKEAGFDINNLPKTLEETETMAAKLFKMDGQLKYSRVAWVPWGGNWYFYGWGWLFGGDFWDPKTKKVTANDPKNVQAMEWLQKFAQKYDIAKINRSPQDLYKGSLVMLNEGNWNLGNFKKNAPKGFDYGVAPVPPPKGQQLSTWSGVWTMIIPRSAKHPKEAWEFLKFASGPVGQAIYAKHTSQTPANIQATRELTDDLKKVFGPYVTEFIDLMDYSHHRPTIPVGSYYWDRQNEAMWDVLNGKKSPQKALDDIQTLVTKELNRVLERTKNRK